jgi:citrate lyase synthetase
MWSMNFAGYMKGHCFVLNKIVKECFVLFLYLVDVSLSAICCYSSDILDRFDVGSSGSLELFVHTATLCGFEDLPSPLSLFLFSN